MKIRQTYITSFLTFVLAICWMLSGILSDKSYEVKNKTKLETISSVTVLNSNALEKAKKIKVSGTTEADKLIKIRAEASGTVVSRPVKQGQFVKKDQLICQLYNASRSSYPKVKAPFDGYLETFSVKEGDYLNTGAVCATIIDPDPMRLIGEVSEKDWWFGISPEGIGTLGMIINLGVALIVMQFTPPPPNHVKELVENIRVPKSD